MDNIVIRKGSASDAKDFSRLFLYTAPEYLVGLFGPRARSVASALFRHRKNTFSFEYSFFLEVDGKIAGMAIAYDYPAKKSLRNYMLVLRYLKFGIFTRMVRLLKAAGSSGQISRDEHYLSGIAVYPKYRGLGFGGALLDAVENDIRRSGKRRMVLRADIDNEKAIALYRKRGYHIEHKTPLFRIRDRSFQFFRMTKEMHFN